jgi:hypothetical protein
MRVNRGDTPEFALALAIAHKKPHDPKVPQPLCKDRPDEFVDYEYGSVPTEAEARALCEGDGTEEDPGCPLLDICRKSAAYSRPDWGVQGGIVYEHGRQYWWVRKLGHAA